MITNQGKTVIKNFFGRQTMQIGGALVVGTGTTAAALTDTKLAYEAARVPVSGVFTDIANNRIVFKATLQPGQVGTIYEVGLYHESRVLSNPNVTLTAQSQPWDGGTLTTANARSSAQTVKVDAPANGANLASQSLFSFDLSDIAGDNTVSVGFFADANLSNVRLRLGSDANNYREFTISSPTAGYNTRRVAWSAGVNTGSVNLSSIKYVGIGATAKSAGATSLYFDGLNIERTAADELVARTVLSTPKIVDADLPTEIEYSLVINV